jgi:hypothetical protein
MADGALANYVKQQVKAGYDRETIRIFLIKNGYPKKAVTEAIQSTQTRQKRSKQPSQQTMLTNYIKQYTKQGYQPEQIQQYLLKQGYSPFTVRKAMGQATKKPFHFSLPKIHLPNIQSKHTLLIITLILLILVAIGGIAWFFINIEFTEKQDTDYDISIDIATLSPGDSLYLTNDFINFPKKREYPITIYYTINDKETLTRVDSWQISFDRSEPLTRSEKHGLTRDIGAGEYELNAKFSYGSTSKQVYAYFTISIDEEELEKAEEVAVGKEQEQKKEEKKEVLGEDKNSTSKSETSESEKTESVESRGEWSVVTGDDYTNYATAKEVAETDATAAIVYCEAVNDNTKKDECFSVVARTAGEKEYCAEIISDPTRDACFIDFAFNHNDFTVCADIANPFVKQSCEQLEQVSLLQ